MTERLVCVEFIGLSAPPASWWPVSPAVDAREVCAATPRADLVIVAAEPDAEEGWDGVASLLRSGRTIVISQDADEAAQAGALRLGALDVARACTPELLVRAVARATAMREHGLSVEDLSMFAAHKLRNVIAAQRGFLSLAQSQPNLPAEALLCLDKVSEAITAADRLARLLYSMTEPLAGVHDPVDLAAAMRQAGRALFADFPLKFREPPDATLINADGTLLSDVLFAACLASREAGGGSPPSVRLERIGAKVVTVLTATHDTPVNTPALRVALFVLRRATGVCGGEVELDQPARGGLEVRLTFDGVQTRKAPPPAQRLLLIHPDSGARRSLEALLQGGGYLVQSAADSAQSLRTENEYTGCDSVVICESALDLPVEPNCEKIGKMWGGKNVLVLSRSGRGGQFEKIGPLVRLSVPFQVRDVRLALAQFQPVQQQSDTT